MAVLRNDRQLHDTLREHPAVCGVRKLDRASQDTMNVTQFRVPSVRKGHARGGEIAVRQHAQHSNGSQRDELGKLPAWLVVSAHWADGQDGLVFMPRDLA